MRIAYIIIAHKNPAQLYRLISRLNDGTAEFFVHIDKKVELSPFQSLSDFENKVHFIRRFDSKWGGYGVIKPFISGLNLIRNSAKPFERILLISGQDYPIKSNKFIKEFFETSKFSNFINYHSIPNYEKWPGTDRGGLYRVDKYYFGNKWYEFFASRSLNFFSRYLPFLKRKLPANMKPYTGQTWWNIDRYAMNYILDYHAKHPEYFRFHRNTFVADELFIQMIIANSNDHALLESMENSEKRFTIWDSPQSAHPKIMTLDDFDAIAASDDLFARKFDDQVDGSILDLIDEKILFV